MKSTGWVYPVGLTGGIATGKTTVARFFSGLGARIVDADAIVHELLRPEGAAYAPCVERFGEEFLDRRGRIDRGALGRRAFADPQTRQALEQILHPRVLEEIERRLHQLRQRPEGTIVVVDAALLVETGTYRRFRRLVVTRCAEATQLRRLQQRDGLSAVEARARMASQVPSEARLRLADYVIDTDLPEEQTARQVARVWGDLLEDVREELCDPR